MSKKIIQIVLGVIMMLGLVSVSACGGGTGVDVDEVRAYADPITEGILMGMNENDYARFSEYFDEHMKEVMPEAAFDRNGTIIIFSDLREVIGDYISKEFWKIETEGVYTIVYYEAEFTEEPGGVIVKVIFQEIEGEMCVSGLWFDSPKLREQ